MNKPDYVKICPKCKSLKINIANKLTTGFLPSEYICNNCKYSGYIFPEIETSKLKLNSKKKK